MNGTMMFHNVASVSITETKYLAGTEGIVQATQDVIIHQHNGDIIKIYCFTGDGKDKS
jgi:hypothetical protein